MDHFIAMVDAANLYYLVFALGHLARNSIFFAHFLVSMYTMDALACADEFSSWGFWCEFEYFGGK